MGSQVAAEGTLERGVHGTQNKGGVALKSVLSNRGLGINAKKCHM